MSSGRLSAEAALTLLDLDERWELEARDLSLPQRVAAKVRSLPAVEPELAEAFFAVAHLVEGDGEARARTGTELDYHNRTHVHDVLRSLSLLLSTKEAGLNAADRLVLMIAMIAHDLGHDGQVNSFPYELESRSWCLVAPTLRSAGLRAAQMEQVRAIILATDPQGYAKLAAPGASGTWPGRALAVDADLFASCLPRYGFRAGWRLCKELQSAGLGGPATDKLATLNGRAAFLRHVPVLSGAAKSLGLPFLIESQLAAIEAMPLADRVKSWTPGLETDFALAVQQHACSRMNFDRQEKP